MNFINGWSYPIFKIYHPTKHYLVETISFPITNSDGLIETVEELKVKHLFLNYSYKEKIDGYRISWCLPYNEYVKKETMFKIQKILRYRKSNYRINLTPRADMLKRHFDVIYTGDTLDFGIKKGGTNAVGNRLVQISFTTKNIVDDPNWRDPDEVTYSGWFLHNRFSVLKT